jgi:hypothetical protein
MRLSHNRDVTLVRVAWVLNSLKCGGGGGDVSSTSLLREAEEEALLRAGGDRQNGRGKEMILV